MIRQPIIAVMGHVDHGKTSLLDKIRNSTVAAREAGGITQHIGASEVPIDVVNSICGPLLKAANIKITIPGLLFIDTPGHEAFTNLRVRGGSVADIAILVVDVTKGFEPQTIEAIEILKQYRTPFVVAANKIDLITGWRDSKSKSLMESLSKVNGGLSDEMDTRVYEMVGKLSEFDFNSELFSRVRDFQKEIAIIPLSAKTGEGIAELLMVVTGLAQRYLEAKLKIEISGAGKGSILEKKEIKGLGTTIDVILYDGTLHANDTVAFATATGISTAKIRALLKPKLGRQSDSASGFTYVDSVGAASGVKISGNGLDEAMPGSPVIQVTDSDYSKEIKSEIGDVFKTDKNGVILKADTIGSMDAISKLVNSAGFGISKKEIGSITKRDVIDAFGMKGQDPLSAVILAFNVGMEHDARELADTSGVKVIEGNIIYKIIDDYKLFVEQEQKLSADKMEGRITFPGAVEILPGACFRASHPAIFGINVISGRIKPGYRMITDSGIVLGKIKGIQNEKEPADSAKKGDRMAISIEGPTFGRQIRENQVLYTYIGEEDYKLLTKDFSNLISDEERGLLEKIRSIINAAKQQL
ncbi:MAG: translation initiation factor IF-2 [Candidatus Micrarchaeota archaeon]|nr:translation initiation factor IF-2 [Candidatus Micrarchaeota archaeon]